MKLDDLVERTVALLSQKAVAHLVSMYFSHEYDFAGMTFHDLEPFDPFDITVADLHAVSLLDVRIRPKATRQLLEDGAPRSTVLELLHRLPKPDIDICDLDKKELEPKSSAWTLWSLLCEKKGGNKYPGIGTATAQKLIARKRPRSIPIVDSVVRAHLRLQESANSWEDIWRLFQNLDVRESIEELQERSGTTSVPDVRVFDAAIWMWRSNSKPAKRAREHVRTV